MNSAFFLLFIINKQIRIMKLLIIALAWIFFCMTSFPSCKPRHQQESKHVQIQAKVEQLVKIRTTFNKNK